MLWSSQNCHIEIALRHILHSRGLHSRSDVHMIVTQSRDLWQKLIESKPRTVWVFGARSYVLCNFSEWVSICYQTDSQNVLTAFATPLECNLADWYVWHGVCWTMEENQSSRFNARGRIRCKAAQLDIDKNIAWKSATKIDTVNTLHARLSRLSADRSLCAQKSTSSDHRMSLQTSVLIPISLHMKYSIYSFIHLFIYSFIHSFIHMSLQSCHSRGTRTASAFRLSRRWDEWAPRLPLESRRHSASWQFRSAHNSTVPSHVTSIVP
jgi:hypothetical protein